MGTLKELISTNYEDYKGVVAIDRQDQFFESIKSLNLLNGVIVGFGFNFGEIKGECKLENVDIYLYVALPEYGESVQDIINSGTDKLKVNKISKRIPVCELGKYIKRFNCFGIYKDINVEKFEIL